MVLRKSAWTHLTDLQSTVYQNNSNTFSSEIFRARRRSIIGCRLSIKDCFTYVWYCSTISVSWTLLACPNCKCDVKTNTNIHKFSEQNTEGCSRMLQVLYCTVAPKVMDLSRQSRFSFQAHPIGGGIVVVIVMVFVVVTEYNTNPKTAATTVKIA